MGDRRQPTPPPTNQRKPAPPPPPPPRAPQEILVRHVADEIVEAHATLDRYGVPRSAVKAWSRGGRAQMVTLSLRQRIEHLHRGVR